MIEEDVDENAGVPSARVLASRTTGCASVNVSTVRCNRIADWSSPL